MLWAWVQAQHTFLRLPILLLALGRCLFILLRLLAVQFTDIINLALALVSGS